MNGTLRRPHSASTVTVDAAQALASDVRPAIRGDAAPFPAIHVQASWRRACLDWYLAARADLERVSCPDHLSLPKSPRVWVLSPPPRPDARHRYADGSLCLYYPRDESWTPRLLLALTIVPWTAYWLACYELWLRTGQWYGPEAPHGRDKQHD